MPSVYGTLRKSLFIDFLGELIPKGILKNVPFMGG